jgi:hypothetical protein
MIDGNILGMKKVLFGYEGFNRYFDAFHFYSKFFREFTTLFQLTQYIPK